MPVGAGDGVTHTQAHAGVNDLNLASTESRPCALAVVMRKPGGLLPASAMTRPSLPQSYCPARWTLTSPARLHRASACAAPPSALTAAAILQRGCQSETPANVLKGEGGRGRWAAEVAKASSQISRP
jgi:hypothetical protein